MLVQVKLLVLALIGIVIVVALIVSRKDDHFKLIILHNNDIHARFEQVGNLGGKCNKVDRESGSCYGGFARVAYKVKEFRKSASNGKLPSVLFLNAGDTYTGTPWFKLYKDEIASDFLNILKPDATSLGNHEFDQGTKNLADFLRKVKFPVLAANVNVNLTYFDSDLIQPSIILDVSGQKVGVIGYLSQEVQILVGNTVNLDGVDFTDEKVAINNEAAKLKAAGVRIIIALGHSGYEIDKQIAAECPDIDVVIGAHSHSFLFTGKPPSSETAEGDYPTMITQVSGKKVPVVQAFWFTKYLGYLQLEFDGEGNLVTVDGAPILLDASVPQDPEVLQLLEKYRPGVLDYESEVGVTKELLDGSCRISECNLGNFITDAMIEWYSSVSAKANLPTDATIALMVGGGIRASVNKGVITKEDAATVLPFDSKVDVMEVPGKNLLDALEYSVRRYTDGEKHGGFLQMSGLKVVYDMNLPPYQRVVEAKVLANGLDVDIDMNKKYKIIAQDFLTNGGDGFEMFKNAPKIKTDTTDLDIFIQHLNRSSPINPSIEGRITIKQKTEEGISR